MVEAGARAEERVVVRLRPYATFYTPPRHVESPDDINPSLLHSNERIARLGRRSWDCVAHRRVG